MVVQLKNREQAFLTSILYYTILTMTTPIETRSRSRFPGILLLLLPALAGILPALAFPNPLLPGAAGDRPSFLLGWCAWLPLMWITQALPRRQVYWATWCYGLACYLVTVTWVSLFGEGALGLVLWLLLALLLSLTPLAALWLTRRMALPAGWTPLVFALAWAGLEWLRGQGIFGLSWSEVGMSQVEGFPARMAALGGVPLITFLMLWVMGALMQRLLRRDAPRWMLPTALSALACCLLGGWWQSHAALTRWQAQTRTLRLTVVQPNTLMGLAPSDLQAPRSTAEQEERNRRDLQRLTDLLNLSAASIKSHPSPCTNLIIWPESAVPQEPYLPGVGAICDQTNGYLLIGAPSLYCTTTQVPVPHSAAPLTMPVYHVHNSAYLFGPRHFTELARYDKVRLVPFGEFVPFRALVAKFYTVRDDDIQPGAGWTPLPAGGHTLGVGICFESTVAEIARRYADQGAQVLVYITNDAWFHQTPAVRQHFNHARFRALETGLPVARASATGISGFIAPDGSILDDIPTYTQGFRTRILPDGIPGTVYTRGGWLFGPACLLVALWCAAAGFIHARRDSRITD